MYQASKQLDYLTFSTTQFKPLDDVLGEPLPRKPLIGNYSDAHEYDCKIIVQWNTLKPQLKTHVTIGGEACQNLRNLGFGDVDIVRWALNMPNIKIGRIDLNVTSMRMDGNDHELKPHHLHWYANIGELKSRLKLNKPVPNQNGQIETAYIGERKKRSKSKLFKAYDKGIELGAEADKIIRYELASYAGAQKVAQRVVAGQDYGGIIRSFVDFPNVPLWAKIMDSEPTKNLFEPDSTTAHQDRIDANKSRWQWLLTTVAPTLGKALLETQLLDNEQASRDMLTAFNKIVEFHYFGDELTSGLQSAYTDYNE